MGTTSEPVIGLLDETWASMAALGAELDEVQWKTASELPGWTLQDIVSHVIGTELMLAGEPVPPSPAEGFGPHVHNQVGEWNEAWVASRRDRTGAEVLAELRTVTDRRRAELAAMSGEDLDRIGFTPEGEGPFRLFLEIRVFDCWLHEQDLRRVVGRPGALDTAPAHFALGRAAGPMAFVVGKRAGAPDGASVLFDVTGPGAFTIPVLVDGGRAGVVDAPAIAARGGPTVTVTTDVEAFAALASGRWSLDDAVASDRVRWVGDDDLARRVVAGMGYTI